MLHAFENDKEKLTLATCGNNNICSMSSNLKNLEMSGNLKLGPKGQGKVREFRGNIASQGKVREFCEKLNCKPRVSHFYSFSDY